MNLIKFSPKDVVVNTVLARPKINFNVYAGRVYYQKSPPVSGSFGNNVKHISPGALSLYEMNIDRPSGSMIYGFFEKDSTRLSYKSISSSPYDDVSQFNYGERVEKQYPLTSSLSRIYVPSGPAFSSSAGDSHENKKYILALRNPINSQYPFNYGNSYGSLGDDEVNIIAIPSIFYGSRLQRGSVNLRYHLTGALLAEASDVHKDGRLVQTTGNASGSIVGRIIYNQGLLLLHSTASLHPTYTDYFNSTITATSPTWNNYGTGINQVGQILEHGTILSSSYSLEANGINKIPVMTLYTYSQKSKQNYSTNPTFLTNSETSGSISSFSGSYYTEKDRTIKKINKSIYKDHDEEFENTTYISKVGIYDKNKELIAVATLAKPIKKVEKKDFMIKLKMDF